MKQQLAILLTALAFALPGRADADPVPLYPVTDLSGPGASPLLSERWTGLGTQSSPEFPSNSGTLADGVQPDSMSTVTLLRKLSGAGDRLTRSIYSFPPGIGLSAPPGYDAYEAAMEIMEGNVTREMADDWLSLGYALEDEGRFEIASTLETPALLGEIVFQINITGFGPTKDRIDAGTHVSSYELTTMFVPVTLSINGLAPVTGEAVLLLYNDAYDSGQSHGFAEVEEVWAFRWDLSGFSDPVTHFEIGFANYPHSSIRGLQVDVMAAAIPEPSTWGLLLGGGALALRCWRKRRSRQPEASA